MEPEDLLLLVTRTMPYGKYEGRFIADLPGPYLGWFARKGFPKGEIGRSLELMYEIGRTLRVVLVLATDRARRAFDLFSDRTR